MKNADAVSREFVGLELGDLRREVRAVHTARALALRSGKTLPKAVKTEAALEGAYRLFQNDDVTPSALAAPHIAATVARCREYARVYAVSDTTEFSFSGTEKREGLGAMQGGRQGFLGQFCIAVAGDGTRRPLGLLAWHTWMRPSEPKRRRSGQERRKDPNRESTKWRRVVENANAMLDDRAAVIHIMDREADAYDLLDWLRVEQLRFVVRVRHDRKLSDETNFGTLFDALRTSPVIFRREVPMNARPRRTKDHPQRTSRTASLQFASNTFSVSRPPSGSSETAQELSLNFVHITEPNPPEGEMPIDWKLVTSEPVSTEEEVAAVVDAYRARWTIEEYFKAIKTGCNYEQAQLESAHTLLNYLALLLPIAWQLLVIRNFGRDTPKRPARELMPALELRVLIAMCPDKLPPDPTIEEAMLGIARLGGHIKNNGAPGWQVLGRGYEDLCRYVEAWEAAQSAMKSDQS